MHPKIVPLLLLALCATVAAAENAPVPASATAPASVAANPPPAAQPNAPQAAAAQAHAAPNPADLPPDPGRFKVFFRPFRTEEVALSPDGKYMAFSFREDSQLYVLVTEVERPDKALCKVLVADNATSTGLRDERQGEDVPARIQWMQWASSNRLVVETNRAFSRGDPVAGWQTWRGCVLAFDADGANAKTLVTPMDVSEALPTAANSADFSTTRRGDRADSKFRAPDKREEDVVKHTGEAEEAPPPSLYTSAPPEQQEALFSQQPRTLHIQGLDPARPGSLLLNVSGSVQAQGTRTTTQYSLDPQTGKLTALAEDVARETRYVLPDRQGRLRVEVPSTVQEPLPHRYDYRGAKGDSRPRPLAESAPAGQDFGVSAANFFGERAVPLGFDEDPNILYFASNVGRDTFGLYSLNLSTHQRASLAIENPAYDMIAAPLGGFPPSDALVFDRYDFKLAGVRYDNALRSTAWLRPDLHEVQAYFEKYFPGHAVELLDWDKAHQRYLLATEGPADAGAFYFFDRQKAKVFELARRAPWIDAEHTHATLVFSYPLKDGTRLGGLITVPRHPRIMPIPVVIVCPDTPWQRVRSDFRTDIHALADMGFAVVQINGRGAWGFGRKHREAIAGGYDLAQLEDMASSLGYLEKMFRVDTKKVALLGRGYGGFVALRAVQDRPDLFRCAIALDAPVDVDAWLKELYWGSDDVNSALTRSWFGDAKRLAEAPLVRAPEKITRPILVLNYGGTPGAQRTGTFLSAKRFAASVSGSEFGELTQDYKSGLPDARAEVFAHIEDFLNVHIYNYTVKLKDLKVVP